MNKFHFYLHANSLIQLRSTFNKLFKIFNAKYKRLTQPFENAEETTTRARQNNEQKRQHHRCIMQCLLLDLHDKKKPFHLFCVQSKA